MNLDPIRTLALLFIKARKIPLVMKFTASILLLSVMTASASTFAQKITLTVKQGSFEAVLKAIHQQSGYDFICTDELLEKTIPVNVRLHDATLQDALASIVNGQPLIYEIDDKVVFFKPRPRTMVDTKTNLNPAIDVTGHVVDEKAKPLPGATIQVKSENLSEARVTVTNSEGYFYLKGIDEKAILIIRFVGYKTAEVPVQKNMMVALSPDMNKLQEVVVSNGYQRIAKDRLTGAAAGLNQDQYQQRVAVTGNFLESLEGKVAGLVYNQQTGQLSIRGVSTFNAVNQPLIVVDGFPTNIDLTTINPQDIISISVLKDAAAASIYGVRASNGVIVVETRRGKSGKNIINVNATTAVQTKPDFGYLKYAPASEFAQLESDAIIAGKQQSLLNLYAQFLGAPLDPVQQARVSQYLGSITADQANQQIAAIGSYDNLKDYEHLFYRDRITNNINVDASGGTAKSTYLLGFNYVGDRLNQKRADNHRYMVNLANTFELNSRMKFDFKSIYTNSTNSSGAVPSYTSFSPYERLTDDNGNALPVTFGPDNTGSTVNAVNAANNNKNLSLGLYDERYFPYAEFQSNSITLKSSSIQLQGRLNTRLTNWLTFDLGGNYQNQNLTNDKLMDQQAFNTRLLLNLSASKDPTTGLASFINIPQGSILRRNNQQTVGYTVRGQFNVNKTFNNGDHDLSAILGVEQRKTTNNGYLNTYFGYDGQTLLTKPYNLVALNSLGSSNPSFSSVKNMVLLNIPRTSTGYFNITNNDNRFMSDYAQVTYVYKQKYIATGSIRFDQSNLFGTDPQYRDRALWSAGLGWRLHKENFLKDVAWIDELKLRASTGFTGNIPNSGTGKYLLLTSGVNTNIFGSPSYYTVSNPENDALRWEVTKNYNIGLDYSLFNSRISGAIDYYIKKSTDLYGSADADPTLGFNAIVTNTASIRNKGLEFSMNSLNIINKSFSWRTGVTASFNKNEVTAVKATPFGASYDYISGTQYVVGKPMNSLFSYNYGGLTNLGQPFVLTRTGAKVIINGTDLDVTQSDLISNGTTSPKYVIGLNNQFSLGSFDFSFLFMYYGGHVMRVQPPVSGLQGAINYWKKPGDEAITLIPALPASSASLPSYYSPFATYGYEYASQFVRRADYIKLRDLVLTYNIRSNALNRIGIVQPQIRLQAQNAFKYTFSGNDIDPEAIDPVSGKRTLGAEPYYSISLYFKF